MQPYFLPYIGYWQLFNTVDEFVLLDDVTFIKQGWINRNRIKINEAAHFITLPLNKLSSNRLINDITISNNGNWQKKILKSIEQNYVKASNYEQVILLIKEIINYEVGYCVDYIQNSLAVIANYLEIHTPMIRASSLKITTSKKASERVIEICQLREATTYINAIGGTELYDSKQFSRVDIELKFLKTDPITYQQIGSPFISSLSIVDVLMNNNKEQIKHFLACYRLV